MKNEKKGMSTTKKVVISSLFIIGVGLIITNFTKPKDEK